MRRRSPVAASAALAVLLLAAGAGCSGTQGSKEAFCAQVKEVPALETVLARFSETDPDILQDRIDKARTAYDDLAEAAPSKIEDETQQVVDLVDEILASVEDNPTDPAKASAQLRTAMAEHTDAVDSRATVTDYALDECDVQLDATLTDGSTTTTTGVTTTTDADGTSGSTTTTTTEAVTSTTG